MRDSASHVYPRNYAITYTDPTQNTLPSMGFPNPAADATVGVPRSYQFSVNGGTAPYNWSATGVPAGWSFITTGLLPGANDTNAQLIGASSAIGTFTPTISVTDSSNPPVTVSQQVPIFSSAMDWDFPPSGTRGSLYNNSATGFYERPIGGSAPYTWAIVGGTFPAGLTLGTTTGLVTGTPTENGGFNPRIRITSSAASGSLTLTRQPGINIAGSATNPNININTTTINDATLNAPYSFQPNACCATGNITWGITSTKPTGLNIDPNTGIISGTPTSPGPFTFTVQATDSASAANFGVRQLTINVTPITMNLSNSFGQLNLPWHATTFTASGGNGSYTWALASGAVLPPGLSLSTGGVLSGTPTSEGAYFLNVTVSDTAGHSRTGGIFFQVYPQGRPELSLQFGPDFGTIPMGTVQFGLGANGGTGTYTWSVIGSLPPGVALRTDVPSFFNSSQQAGLFGVLTTAGTYHFTLQVVSGNQTVTQQQTVKVTNLDFGDVFNLPDAFAGSAYRYQFTAIGAAPGTPTFTLPTPSQIPGFTLSTAGVLTGTPAAGVTYNVSVTVNDGTDSVTRNFSLFGSPIKITTPGQMQNGTQGASYPPQLLAATGGSGGITFSLPNGPGSLPNGLTLSNGTIAGTINTGPGNYNFPVKATDANNNSYTKNMSIDVIGSPAAALPRVNAFNYDDMIVGDGYSTSIGICCGGVAPFAWTVIGLPPGIAFRYGSGVTSNYVSPGNVEIYGYPRTAGTFHLVFTVTDANGATSSLTIPFNVGVLDQVNGLPNGIVNQSYSAPLRVVGGTGPWSAAPGPAGANLPPNGVALNGLSLAGTPLETGFFNPQFTYSDSGGNSVKRSAGFNIAGGAANSSVSINTYYDLGITGTGGNFSRTLNASCSNGCNVTWAGPTLPPGLSLTAGGVLSGTTTTSGTYTFTVTAADAAGVANPAVRQFKLQVSPLNITTNSVLGFGNITEAYGPQGNGIPLAATGNVGTLTWSLDPFNYLPLGLTLSSAGVISGAPTSTGQYGFNISVVDSANNNKASRFFTLSVYLLGQTPTLVISNNANLGTYPLGVNEFGLFAAGGTGTYVWSVHQGTSLPAGFTLRTDIANYIDQSAQAGNLHAALQPRGRSRSHSTSPTGTRLRLGLSRSK